MPKEETKKADGTSASEKKTAKVAKKKTKTAKATKSTKKTVAAKKKATAKKATAKKTEKGLRVRQVRSGIRHPHRMRRTLTALGLKHHQDEVVVPDNASTRGMLKLVHHLVSVTPEETNG